QPALDKIMLPCEELFADRESMLAVLLHEICHSTAHKKRANRDLSGRMGSPSYSFEELIAELGAMMLYSSTGLTPSEHQVRQSAAYMKGWAEVLKQDPSKILKAASAAQKAVAYIEELLPKPVVDESANVRHVVRLAM
ncbi:MAG: zincin-like metallopeptidase domain-containing protein, partial [Proteobacteria bacterium]|nr:zincin-like metallopeptidase domain-containing protein [Pseudomonadota bacterium]